MVITVIVSIIVIFGCGLFWATRRPAASKH